MFNEQWAGIDFKLGEARYFLDGMGKLLVPARLDTARHHPAHGMRPSWWQPDFYYYLD